MRTARAKRYSTAIKINTVAVSCETLNAISYEFRHTEILDERVRRYTDPCSVDLAITRVDVRVYRGQEGVREDAFPYSEWWDVS